MALAQHNIESVVSLLHENTENDFFNCLAITGSVRRGKSRLAKLLVSKLYPNFSYADNYIGNPKHGDSFRRLYDSPPKSACWIDEGEKILSAERRMDKDQWWLQQLFNQFASHNKTIIICTPKFRRIDPRWRDTHITVWIHLFRRGAGVLLKRREVESIRDVWGLDSMRESEEKMRADSTSDEAILQNYDKNPCALFYFNFPDWDSEEEEQEYSAAKKVSQQALRSEFEEWENEKRAMLMSASLMERGLGRTLGFLYWKHATSFSELGSVAGLGRTTASRLVNEFYESVEKDESLPPKIFPPEFRMFAKKFSGGNVEESAVSNLKDDD